MLLLHFVLSAALLSAITDIILLTPSVELWIPPDLSPFYPYPEVVSSLALQAASPNKPTPGASVDAFPLI